MVSDSHLRPAVKRDLGSVESGLERLKVRDSLIVKGVEGDRYDYILRKFRFFWW